jgi:serine/threonine protein kinase
VNDHLNREDAIVDAALELPPDQRSAYLDKVCAEDPRLRALAQALLRAHARFNVSHQPATAPHLPVAPNPDGGGRVTPKPSEAVLTTSAEESRITHHASRDRIGHYKLLEQIGEGGCGIVYVAEQEEPVRRRVALKVIKLGMDTRQVIARFEAERQALALMDHPNIAKVLDAGATETGRPYFVMELVKGISIIRYCDENRMDTQGRLKLFIQVCQAIQHAHQKGIIHRDIKPSNILVADHDGTPVPKIIDFGIAKATTDQRLTDKTLYTALEQFIGTPAYMSPEQAKLSGLDIDTRSDIYSLGVLLYELLTGKVPFEPKELAEAGLEEMRRIIREKDAVRPSTRLSTLELAERTSIAQRRLTDAPKLIHLIRGDLDWIVMKCLEKDRSRRYETANGLGRDIERYLSNQPVMARPPSKSYRLGKLIRRNKLAFAAFGAVAAALVIGLAVSSWLFVRERGARRQTRAETAKSQAVARLLADTLGGVDPSVARGMDTALLKMILTNASQRIGQELAGQPEAEADIRVVLGKTLWAIGQLSNALAQTQEAVRLRRKCLGPTNDAVADALAHEGAVLYELGDMSSAERIGKEALAMREAVLGPDDPKVASSLNNVGNALWHQTNKLAEAEQMHRRALLVRKKVLPADHPDILQSAFNLATVLFLQGDCDGAETSFREALAKAKKIFGGPDHPGACFIENNLAKTLASNGEAEESQALHQKVLSSRQKLYGGDHGYIAESMTQLAVVTAALGDPQAAERLLRDALAMQSRLGMEGHSERADTLLDLGAVLMQKGAFAAAETNFQAALRLRQGIFGLEHPELSDPLDALALLKVGAGDLESAEKLVSDALRFKRIDLPPGHPDLVPFLLHMSWIEKSRQHPAQALTLRAEAMDIVTRHGRCGAQAAAEALGNLADVLQAHSKHAQAEQVLVEAVDFCQSPVVVRSRVHRHLLAHLVRFYELWDAAEPGAGKGSNTAEWKQKLSELEKADSTQPSAPH